MRLAETTRDSMEVSRCVEGTRQVGYYCNVAVIVRVVVTQLSGSSCASQLRLNARTTRVS
jgi:hypothetical protein